MPSIVGAVRRRSPLIAVSSMRTLVPCCASLLTALVPGARLTSCAQLRPLSASSVTCAPETSVSMFAVSRLTVWYVSPVTVTVSFAPPTFSRAARSNVPLTSSLTLSCTKSPKPCALTVTR
jgi:hypothetical protein